MIFPIPKRPDGRTPEANYAQRLFDEVTARRQISVDGVQVDRTTRGDVVIPQMRGGGGGGSSSIKVFRLFDVRDDYLICVPPPIAPSATPAFGTPRLIGSFHDSDLDTDGFTIIINASDIPPTKYHPVKNDTYWNETHFTWNIFDGSAWQTMKSQSRKDGGGNPLNYDATLEPIEYVAKEYRHRTSIIGEILYTTSHLFSYQDGPTEVWAAGTAGHYNKIRKDYDGTNTERQRFLPVWYDGEPILSIACNNTGVTRPTSDEDDTPIAVKLHIFGRPGEWAGPN